MKRGSSLVGSILTLPFAKAQTGLGDFGNFLESMGPSMNSLAGALFVGTFTGNMWLNIVAFWIVAGVLINTWLARFNLPTGSKKTLAVIGGYFIINNPFILGWAASLNEISSLAVIILFVGLFSWLLPKITVGQHTKEHLAEKKKEKLTRKEKKRTALDEKLNSLESYLASQEQQLEANETKLEQTEGQKLSQIEAELKQILRDTEAEEMIMREIQVAQKMAKKLGDPLKVQAIQQRYQQYKVMLDSYQKRLNAELERLSQDELQEEALEEQEEGVIDQEEEEIKAEVKDEKKGIKNVKKNVREESAESKDKFLPAEERTDEAMQASEGIVELKVEWRKKDLMAEKRSLASKKGGKKSAVKSKNKKIRRLLDDIRGAAVDATKKRKIVNAMIKLNEDKVAINTEVEDINRRLQAINEKLKQLEQQEMQMEAKEARAA